jgi:hypothetical protein
MREKFAPRIIVDDRMYRAWRDELDVEYAMRVALLERRLTDQVLDS